MRRATDTEEDLSPGVTPAAAWRVTSARVVGPHRLEVAFVDGTVGQVDLSALIDTDRAGVFAALRDSDLFARVQVAYGAVSWPGDLDLPPDAMYDAIRSSGHWTPT